MNSLPFRRKLLVGGNIFTQKIPHFNHGIVKRQDKN